MLLLNMSFAIVRSWKHLPAVCKVACECAVAVNVVYMALAIFTGREPRGIITAGNGAVEGALVGLWMLPLQGSMIGLKYRLADLLPIAETFKSFLTRVTLVRVVVSCCVLSFKKSIVVCLVWLWRTYSRSRRHINFSGQIPQFKFGLFRLLLGTGLRDVSLESPKTRASCVELTVLRTIECGVPVFSWWTGYEDKKASQNWPCYPRGPNLGIWEFTCYVQMNLVLEWKMNKLHLKVFQSKGLLEEGLVPECEPARRCDSAPMFETRDPLVVVDFYRTGEILYKI